MNNFNKIFFSLFLITPVLGLSEAQVPQRPVLTTAGVVIVCPQNTFTLIERGKPPYGLALFGGHVEHESPLDAFKREAQEELSIHDLEKIKLIGVHGEPNRDPRQHSVEITYHCITHEKPIAASDARKIRTFTKPELKEALKKENFAFDHKIILSNYLEALGDCNPCNEECTVRLSD